MGLFGQLIETLGENISKDKEEREQEKSFVRNNKGSLAISSYIADLFEKGNPAYLWLKENRKGLYPVMNYNSVALCYMQNGDGQSFSGMKPKDIAVFSCTFLEIYRSCGLPIEDGYERLNSRTQLNELEDMINEEIRKHPHLKYGNGFLVKMFQ